MIIPWQDIAEITVSIATVIGALAVIYKVMSRYVVRPLKKKVAEYDQAIAELRPNGGMSIRDRICRIDKSVEHNAARTLAIQDAHPIGTFESDADGQCTYANKALCDMMGLDRSQMVGNGWLEGVSSIERSGVLSTWQECVARDIPYEHTYELFNHKTKSRTMVRAVAHPMLNSFGEVVGYHGTVEPVGGKGGIRCPLLQSCASSGESIQQMLDRKINDTIDQHIAELNNKAD